jgi:hypothetical protein
MTLFFEMQNATAIAAILAALISAAVFVAYKFRKSILSYLDNDGIDDNGNLPNNQSN